MLTIPPISYFTIQLWKWFPSRNGEMFMVQLIIFDGYPCLISGYIGG